MKLNHDLIRDVLLFSEDLSFNKSATGDDIFKSKRLSKYSIDEIIYAITRIGDNDAQLIKGNVLFASGKPYRTVISGLTFNGHKYLDNIRDPKVWSETKKISSKVTGISIDIMSQIASQVILKMLNLN
ncbi:DUF2513 domain-containing protein [Listeria monocytogenes]|nr:DUF2513 domain-containing protein [Listeria monocytogenes]